MIYVNFRKDVVTSVIDTCSKLALRVEDTDAVVTRQYLPMVLLTPVVHL